jgi:hypothetical protein
MKNKSNSNSNSPNNKPRRFASVKNSPPMKRKSLQNKNVNTQQPTFIQLTPSNKKPINVQQNVYTTPSYQYNIDNKTRSISPNNENKTRSKSKSGGFGTLDPLLAAVFLAGVRMSMNQKNKVVSSLSAKKNTKSKRS